jgi:sugar phosphate isomerase/epimerase
LKLVGPIVDEVAILAYCEKVFQRCKLANVHLIIWGSGGARRIPDGFDLDIAHTQFVSIARKVATLAANYQITLALENLNSKETNFINLVEAAIRMVMTVNHPNFKLCVEIYHMLCEGEGPSVLKFAEPYLVHCDIAEGNNRGAPATEDFTPYLKALKKIKYKEKIIIECRWENLEMQAQPALRFLQKQINTVYK